MKRKNVLALVLTLVLSTSLISCGSDEGGGAPAVTTPAAPTTPTVTGNLAQEGNFQPATSLEQFKSFVSSGAFAKANFQQIQNNYNFPTTSQIPGVVYVLRKCGQTQSTSDFLGVDWTSTKTSCDDENPIQRKEYSDGVVESDFGGSKQAIQTNLLSAINSGTNHQLTKSGYALNFAKDGYIYTIDFTAPMTANPVSKAKIENNMITESWSYSVWYATQK